MKRYYITATMIVLTDKPESVCQKLQDASKTVEGVLRVDIGYTSLDDGHNDPFDNEPQDIEKGEE